MTIDGNDFNDILQRFDKLSRADRQELMNQLEQHQASTVNGVESSRSLFDALNERGMAGSIKKAPSDWSSNPSYLEGLGLEGLGQNAE